MKSYKDMTIDEIAKKIIKDTINKVEGFYLYGGDMSEGLAEYLLTISESVPGFMYDVKQGMEYIADNHLYFNEVYSELKEKGICINPLENMEKCIGSVLVNAMQSYLLDSSLINEHEHDEGFSIELTKEILDEMVEDMGMKIDREEDIER